MNKKTTAIIILSVVFVIGVIVMAIFAQFIDNTDIVPAIAKQDKLSYNQRKDIVMASSLQDIAANKTFSMLFTQEELNLFVNAYIKEKVPQSGGVCFTFKPNNVVFMELSLRANGIKTVLRANLQASMDDKGIAIVFSNVRIGKAGKSLTNMLFNQKSVKKVLTDNNIFADYNGKTSTMTFSVSQLKKTFDSLYKDSENAELYAVMFDKIFSQKGIFNLQWGIGGKIGGTADLQMFEYKQSVHGDIPFDPSLQQVAEKLEYLLKNKVISTEDASTVFKFILQGYKLLDQESKEIIDKLSLQSIGINQNITYNGTLSQYEQSVIEIFTAQLKHFSLPLTDKVKLLLDAETLNSSVVRLPIIGQGAVYCHGENLDKASYIVVKSMFFRIEEDNINITLIVSLNGYQIAITSDFFGHSSSNFAFTAHLNNTIVGSMPATKSENESLMRYLKTAFAEHGWIQCDAENLSITFDFEKVVDKWILKTLFLFGFNTKVSAVVIEDKGYLVVELGFSLFK